MGVFHGPDPSYKIDTLTDLPKNVPDSVYKIDTLTDLPKNVPDSVYKIDTLTDLLYESTKNGFLARKPFLYSRCYSDDFLVYVCYVMY